MKTIDGQLVMRDERIAIIAARFNESIVERLIEGAVAREAQLQTEEARTKYEAALAAWKEKAAEAKAAGKQVPRGPASPDAWLKGNARPGNIFAGVVHPTLSNSKGPF